MVAASVRRVEERRRARAPRARRRRSHSPPFGEISPRATAVRSIDRDGVDRRSIDGRSARDRSRDRSTRARGVGKFEIR
jgi:hypothetical protein